MSATSATLLISKLFLLVMRWRCPRLAPQAASAPVTLPPAAHPLRAAVSTYLKTTCGTDYISIAGAFQLFGPNQESLMPGMDGDCRPAELKTGCFQLGNGLLIELRN